MQSRQMTENVQAERAFYFAPFLTAVYQGGRTEDPRKMKKSTYFYFDENGEKLKKLEKFLVSTFSPQVKYNNNLRKRFYKHE